MDTQVRKSLDASLIVIEMNISLLRAALSTTLVPDDEVLGNERASLVVLKSIDLLKSITLYLEDIGQPIEDELKKAAKESYVNLQNSLDSFTSVSDASIKERFQEIRETLKKVEKEHQDRRHPKDGTGTLPLQLCSTILCEPSPDS